MNVNNKMLYEELRPEQFVERINACPIAYLPLGTLEWHGLHLPLGSDGLQSQGFFMKLAEQVGGIVLPMLFIGPDDKLNKDGFDYIGMDHYSFEDGHPQQLEGTAYWVEDELFFKVVEAVLANLARAGFKVVVAHGHGPSTKLFKENIPDFENRFGLKLFILWNEEGKISSNGIQTDHAALNETSLVMALRPELVDMSGISDDAIPLGVWGIDPRIAASQAAGDEIIEKNLVLMKEKLQAALSEIAPANRKMSYHHVNSSILIRE